MTELLNIDCMEYMNGVPNKYFDLAVVDIPYGINVGNMAYLTELNTTVKQKNGNRLNGNANKKAYKKKDWDNKTPTQDYFDELKRVSVNQIVFGSEYVKWQGMGNGRIKWDKGFAKGMSFNRYETAYCSLIEHEITVPLLWAGMCQAKSLSEPMTQQGNKKLNEKRIHPCHKPRLLYKWIYEKYAKQGDKILDTHFGSCSSGIVAHLMGYDFVGCEIDKDYFNDANVRFKKETDLGIFSINEKVF